MRTKQNLRPLLLDLVEWGEKTARAASRTSLQAIASDGQAELALARAVEIVGEIAGRLIHQYPDWYREQGDEDLQHAYRMRNKPAHGYETIIAPRLYEIARNDVSVLTSKAKNWLANLPDDRP